jgi:hypothetical protein
MPDNYSISAGTAEQIVPGEITSVMHSPIGEMIGVAPVRATAEVGLRDNRTLGRVAFPSMFEYSSATSVPGRHGNARLSMLRYPSRGH